MKLIHKNIKWIMLVFGGITSIMLAAVFAPDMILNSVFGDTVNDPLAKLITQSWGALIGIIGLLLIYGAFNEEHRKIAIVLATISKFVFVLLLIISGEQYLNSAFFTIIIDGIAVLIFVIYLLSVNRENA